MDNANDVVSIDTSSVVESNALPVGTALVPTDPLTAYKAIVALPVGAPPFFKYSLAVLSTPPFEVNACPQPVFPPLKAVLKRL